MEWFCLLLCSEHSNREGGGVGLVFSVITGESLRESFLTGVTLIKLRIPN